MCRLFAALVLLPALACAPKLIPETNIVATPESQAIYALMGQYRQAVEGRDVDGIMKLVSKSFFENSGTPEANDDYNYDALAKRLQSWAEQVKSARVALQVKGILVDGATARAPYFFDTSYQIEAASGAVWKRNTDVKEMRFKKDDDGVWRIAAGI